GHDKPQPPGCLLDVQGFEKLNDVGDFFFLAIEQIAQSGLSSLKVIYYSAQLFRLPTRGNYCFYI
ncbi:TPA: hypothetical protein ACWCAD_005062, partial [Escherichia coli]